MAKSIVVDRFPIPADKGAYQEQQGRLRLMDIGDELVHDAESVSGFDHDLCLGVQRFLVCGLQIVHYRLQGFSGRDGIFFLVGFELIDMDFEMTR